MDLLSFYISNYRCLYNRRFLHGRILSPIRYFVRELAAIHLEKHFLHSKRKQPKKQVPIIVSLTSFPARIPYVWMTIECMLRQTYQPKKILLWLSNEQFSDKDKLPSTLTNLENSIFEIRFVDGDIRSHKKYQYVACQYPDDYVFFIDDDLFYNSTILEETWEEHLKHPDAVISSYGYRINYDDSGKIRPYMMWKQLFKPASGKDIFVGSGGGTMIKPSFLYKDLTNLQLALDLCPTADDVWLNCMMQINKLEVYILKNGLIMPLRIPHNPRLSVTNQDNNMNDVQIQKCIEHYKNFKVFQVEKRR